MATARRTAEPTNDTASAADPKALTAIAATVPPSQLDGARTALSPKTAAVLIEISTLTVASNEDYADADLLLARVRQARKLVADKTEPIISPIYQGLQALYAFRRELDKPLENAEKAVKAKMAGWQESERRRIEAERDAARREELRKQREAAEAQRLAEEAARNARTQKQREEAAQAAANAARIAEEAASATQVAIEASREKVVTGVASKVTVIKRPVVTDMTRFIAAVVAGEVPEICLMVNEEVMEEYWKQDRGLVSVWPGVSVEEVTRVGGK